jgi:hypothetical protein
MNSSSRITALKYTHDFHTVEGDEWEMDRSSPSGGGPPGRSYRYHAGRAHDMSSFNQIHYRDWNEED